MLCNNVVCGCSCGAIVSSSSVLLSGAIVMQWSGAVEMQSCCSCVVLSGEVVSCGSPL